MNVLIILHCMVKKYAAEGLIHILGDFSVRLLTNDMLCMHRYRSPMFTANSHLVYDFLCDNKLMIVDLMHKHSVPYSFFCIHLEKTNG